MINYKELFLHDSDALIKEAGRVCREIHGGNVYVRGLIEFSNFCSMNCNYCGIRKDNSKAHRYRMTPDQIVSAAHKAFTLGIKTFVLQSGEDPFFTDEVLCGIIKRIKTATDGVSAITLSAGIRSRESYRKLKAAGADRYLIRFETSDEKIYESLKSGQKLETRLNAIRTLKDLGYETGSGFMVNLPGETDETIIQNCELCRDLELDMVGIGPFIPHPKTPLADSELKGVENAVKAAALTRILLPYAHIPATTAAATIDPLGREKMLAAGANVVMPNITPEIFKKIIFSIPAKYVSMRISSNASGVFRSAQKYAGKNIELSVAGKIPR